MQEYLSVGCMVNTHGVKGEIKVNPATSDVSRFEYLYRILVDMSPAGAGKGDKQSPDRNTPLKEFFVEGVRYHKNSVLLKLRHVDEMSAAEAMKGREIWVSRTDARKLDEDEWFICDLIGMTVREDGLALGKLTEVLETGSNDVYVVLTEAGKGKEILIPALKDVILKVDIEAGLMDVKLPEGLLDEV